MQNLTTCDRSTIPWVTFKSEFKEFFSPSLVIPLLLTLLVCLWLIPVKPWRRISLFSAAFLLVTYGVVISQPFITLAYRGLMQFVPPDSGMPADAIVVLGRGKAWNPSRTQVATSLWQAGRAPVILASGRGDGFLMHQLLKAEGVPDAALYYENCSQTTEENAQFSAALLRPAGVERILLVTDPAHMLRSQLTFQSLGFTVVPHPTPLPSLNLMHRADQVYQEYGGLISYTLKGRFLPRQPSIQPNISQQLQTLKLQ